MEELWSIKLREDQDLHFDKIVTIIKTEVIVDKYGNKWIRRDYLEGGCSFTEYS